MAVDPIIKQKAEDIRHKIYGKEVRESLASGIEAMSEDVVSVTGRQATVEEQFQSVIDETTGKDVISAPEIILARDGEADLKTRLDKEKQEVSAQLAHKAQQSDLDITNQNVSSLELNKASKTELQSIASGSPKGTYATLTDLQNAYPTGDANIYLVSADGNWYYWEGASWVSGGVYQATALNNETVTQEKTNFLNVGSTNLFNKNTITPDKTINTATGVINDNATTSISDFIPTQPNTKYIGRWIEKIAYYDSGKKFISALSIPNSEAFTTPSNAYYVKIVLSNASITSTKFPARLNEGETLLDFEPYSLKIDNLKTDGSFIENLNVKSQDTDFVEVVSNNIFNKDDYLSDTNFSNTTGVLVVSEGFRTSKYIDAKPETTYTQKGILKFAFYDSNDRFLGYSGTGLTFTTPAQTRYMRTCHYTGNHQVNEGNTLLEYDEYTVKVKGVKINRPSLLTPSEQLEKFKTETKYLIDGVVDGVYSSPTLSDGDFADMLTTELHNKYDGLVSSYPSYITKSILGQNSLGQDIHRYDFKPTPVRDNVGDENIIKMILISGVHPEKGGAITLYNAMKQICDNWKNDELLETLRWNVHFIVVPVVTPYAFDNKSRINENGVDIARNFPTDWRKGTLGEQTYGGTHPLSEKESQYVDAVMNENKDAIFFTSFHNFYQELTNKDFIWNAAGTQMQIDLGKKLISKMTRKWKKEHVWLPQGEDVYFGYSIYGAPVGSEGRHAVSYGIQGGTFEICETLWLEDSPKKFSSNMLTFGAETFINYLLLNLKNNVEYYNQKKS